VRTRWFIFPEREVYHTNDRATPFRNRLPTMALKKTERPI